MRKYWAVQSQVENKIHNNDNKKWLNTFERKHSKSYVPDSFLPIWEVGYQ